MSLFSSREEAGRQLAALLLESSALESPVSLGLARGGVVVAAEVARTLRTPLDAIAVRKVGHPYQPEYALGAVAPGGVSYVRGPDGLSVGEITSAVEDASRRAAVLDAELHAGRPPVDLSGATALVIDDGLATGATMIAACRWARAHGARAVVAAAPVVALRSLPLLENEADDVVALATPDPFGAVGLWYHDFPPVSTTEVLQLLESATSRSRAGAAPG